MTVELVASAIESFLYIIFLNQFNEHKKNGFWKWCSTIIASLLLLINIVLADYITVYHWSTTLIDGIVVFTYGALFLHHSWLSWLISAVLYNLGLIGSVIICMGISSAADSGGVTAWLMTGTKERMLLLFINKIILIIYIFGILKMKKIFWDDQHIRLIYGVVLFVPILVISMACLILTLLVENYRTHEDTAIFVLLLAGIFVLLIFIFYLLIYAIRKDEKARENHVLREMLDAQKNSFMREIANYDKIRKIEHDMKNRLLGIKYYYDQGMLEKGADYLNEVISDLTGKKSVLTMTGSSQEYPWEALVDIKMAQAKEKGITISQKITPGRYEQVNPLDLCVIIGNLLDNAIEAEDRNLLKKELSIKIKESHRYIVIDITNWVDENYKQDALQMISRKQDSVLHGIGIRSVSEIVKKYDGKMKMVLENNQFQVQAVLPLQEEVHSNLSQ